MAKKALLVKEKIALLFVATVRKKKIRQDVGLHIKTSKSALLVTHNDPLPPQTFNLQKDPQPSKRGPPDWD